MSETTERPILDRLATFFDDYDAFYNEPVPMLATQLCADAHDEITKLTSQLEEARAETEKYKKLGGKHILDASRQIKDKDAENDRLTARIEELKKALAPFAKFVETDVTKQVLDGCVIVIPNRNVANFTYGDLRRAARSTLEASDRNGGGT